MNEQELRAMIRESIARHRGADPLVEQGSAVAQGFSPAIPRGFSPAFGRFLLARPAGDDACIIEPSVKCNHCGFCQSYGH